MRLAKTTKGFDLAVKMVRQWPNAALVEREPHELSYTYGLTRTEAEKIIREERYRRNL